MEINVDEISTKDLIALNAYLVETIKRRREQEVASELSHFEIGDHVFFDSNDGERVHGMIVRVNKKTISIEGSDSRLWRVSPCFVRKSEDKVVSLFPVN